VAELYRTRVIVVRRRRPANDLLRVDLRRIPTRIPLPASGHSRAGGRRETVSFRPPPHQQQPKNHLTAFTMSEREENVYKAKLAEQAERYEGECTWMRVV